MALWVKMDTVVTGNAFFACYGNFEGDDQAYYLGAGYMQLFWSSLGSTVYGPVLVLGEWYHVAVTNIGYIVTLYLNGELVGSSTNFFYTPAETQFYLGRMLGSEGDSRLNGLVDEVVVFDRALAAEEIMELYQRGFVSSDVPWLSIEPLSGTLEANISLPLQVAYDSTALPQDAYTTALYLLSNNALTPIREIPITLTVYSPSGRISLPLVKKSNQISMNTPLILLAAFSNHRIEITYNR
jgi:hypothetical protein